MSIPAADLMVEPTSMWKSSSSSITSPSRFAVTFTEPVPPSVLTSTVVLPVSWSPRVTISPSIVMRSPETMESASRPMSRSPVPSSQFPAASLFARSLTWPAAVTSASISMCWSASMRTAPPVLVTVVLMITSWPAVRTMSPVAISVSKSSVKGWATISPSAVALMGPAVAVTVLAMKRSPPFAASVTAEPVTVSTRMAGEAPGVEVPVRATGPAASIDEPWLMATRPSGAPCEAAVIVTVPPVETTLLSSQISIPPSETTPMSPTAVRSCRRTEAGSSMSISAADSMDEPETMLNEPDSSLFRFATTFTEPVPAAVVTIPGKLPVSAASSPIRTPSPSSRMLSPETVTDRVRATISSPEPSAPLPSVALSARSRTCPAAVMSALMLTSPRESISTPPPVLVTPRCRSTARSAERETSPNAFTTSPGASAARRSFPDVAVTKPDVAVTGPLRKRSPLFALSVTREPVTVSTTRAGELVGAAVPLRVTAPEASMTAPCPRVSRPSAPCDPAVIVMAPPVDRAVRSASSSMLPRAVTEMFPAAVSSRRLTD